MKAITQLDQTTTALLRNFFQAYVIAFIRITRAADIREAEVSQVDIRFGQPSGSSTRNYSATFKLLDQACDSHRYLRGMGAAPDADFRLDLTTTASECGSDEICSCVRALIDSIRTRVAKVHKEQSILGTRPVGKTFVLYNKTRFKVLSDNGEGQLAIRIIRKDGGDEASLSANDLLDGLYSGAITEA